MTNAGQVKEAATQEDFLDGTRENTELNRYVALKLNETSQVKIK